MKVLVNESSLKDIANAIRNKNGDTTKYKPSEMSSAINNITTTTVSPNYNIRFSYSKNETISLGWLRTNNMTSMNCMFNSCRSLTSLDLSNFDTSKVTDMQEMFDNCMSLTSLDLSNFNTSKVTDMYDMFDNCLALKTLDIRNFTFAQLTDERTSSWGIFGDDTGWGDMRIPADCKIIVKDDAVRNWIKSAKYATGYGDNDYKTYGDYFTNIKTVAEL